MHFVSQKVQDAFERLWLTYILEHGTYVGEEEPYIFVDSTEYSINVDYKRYGAETAFCRGIAGGWRIVANWKLVELCTRFLPAEEVQLAMLQSELRE